MIIIPNRFITKIEQALGTVEINAIKEYVKSPLAFERKDDVPMMCMAEFIFPELGRCYNNFKSLDSEWLALDFDDNITIDKFMQTYKDYDYILYTSFNHTATHHKFRVLLHYCGLDYSLLGDNAIITFSLQNWTLHHWKIEFLSSLVNVVEVFWSRCWQIEGTCHVHCIFVCPWKHCLKCEVPI